MSFITVHHRSCPSSTDKVNSSIIGGNISARAQLAKAPIRDIRRSKCGTADAIPTEKKTQQ